MSKSSKPTVGDRLDLPVANTTDNNTIGEVVGQKNDTAAGTSLIAIVKALTLTTTTLKGLVFYARCDAGMAGSITTIVTDDMIGFGDSFFNTKFYIYIVKNANSVGAVPDGQIRQISTYTSVSGTFVCVAFTANVEADDDIFIIHESLAGFVSTFVSSGISNDFDGCLMEILKAGLEKTTAGAFDPDTDSNEAISLAITALNNISTGQVNAEVVDVVNTDDKLDKLISVDDRPAATVYPVSVVAESILAFIMSKSASPDASSYSNLTDSLEAISDYLQGVTTLPNAAKREAGRTQVAVNTGDLITLTGSYVELTATGGDVIIEGLMIRLAVDMTADATLVSIALQTDDTTPAVFVSAATGVKASCTAQVQFMFTGHVLLVSGKSIVIVVDAGAGVTGNCAYTTDVSYHAVTDGAYLA